MRILKIAPVLLASLAMIAAAQAPPAANVTEARLSNAINEPGQWMTYGGTYEEQRYANLSQITTDNVKQLGLTWFADFDTNRGQEATPIYVDGVIYVSTAWSKVYAYDARTGRQLWFYNPVVPGEWGSKACCDVVNRGVAVWNGKVYIATLDGRLNAIDARNGKELWSVNTINRDQPYSSTGAPRVVKGKVIIGNAGAEFGVRGYVTAYDAETGKQVWRFYTVPGNPADGFETPEMEMAAKTWDGEWWKSGGGGTAWDALTYDPVSNLLYIGVGNGSPWNASVRSPGTGDNLFLSSIVAVDPDTGQYKWHYQTVQRDSWDFTAVQQITVANLKIDGRDRRVIMQAPKNGLFYVLDAKTGELLSGTPFVKVNWMTGIDMKTGRPIENPWARYDVTGVPYSVIPWGGGGHSWHPMSYSPQTGYVYIPTMERAATYAPQPGYVQRPAPAQNYAAQVNAPGGTDVYLAALPQNEGRLIAWDPIKKTEVWRVPFGSGRGGGTLATAGGLVFQGNSVNQEFVAYRGTTGEKLWSMPAQTGIVAGPISYELDGVQYVAVTAGNNQGGDFYSDNNSRLLVFKLGGTAQLPAPVRTVAPPFDPPAQTASAEVVERGRLLYATSCQQCHGANVVGNSGFPDLRRGPILKDKAYFDDIVLHGALLENGMGDFSSVLNQADVNAIFAYLIDRSIAARDAPPPPGRGGGGGGGGAAAAPAPAAPPAPAPAPAAAAAAEPHG